MRVSLRYPLLTFPFPLCVMSPLNSSAYTYIRRAIAHSHTPSLHFGGGLYGGMTHGSTLRDCLLNSLSEHRVARLLRSGLSNPGPSVLFLLCAKTDTTTYIPDSSVHTHDHLLICLCCTGHKDGFQYPLMIMTIPEQNARTK